MDTTESGNAAEIRGLILRRANLIEAIRSFFASRGSVEVSTPSVVLHPNLDPNVPPIPVRTRDSADVPTAAWLHTSPELSMKKLLAAGSGDIFQIGSVFRDREGSPLHRCEFTMLEWYRVEADYEAAVEDTVQLIRSACRAVTGGTVVSRGGRDYHLDRPWEDLTMAEAFRMFAGIGSFNRDDMAACLDDLGYRPSPEEPLEELFFRIYVDRVEPFMGMERPTVVRDFPDFLGTMARPKRGSPGLLERFEIYIGGVELANGYSELTDVGELRRRMKAVRDDLERSGVAGLTVDERFLEAVHRMPQCAGVSLGIDRLLMLLLGREDISEVMFPYGAEF